MYPVLQRWINFLTALDYTLEYGKGSANGNADFVSRLPEPATEQARNRSSSLTPVNYDDIVPIWACRLRTRSSPTPGVGSGGLAPRPKNAACVGSISPLRFFAVFVRAGNV